MDNAIKTNNLISTPNITGNIGSCTSQEVSTISGRTSLWTIDKTNIITNSCTGEITTFNTWEFSGLSWFGFILPVLFLVVIIHAWASNDSF